ncbi:ATP-binding protein [Saccharicrinis sp. GN24d3]|uniref:ATP-binding protein n=1 Tax=Saccharicrinis sp. GN24d3 TaxID=3458416 RepID=UPI004036BA24
MGLSRNILLIALFFSVVYQAKGNTAYRTKSISGNYGLSQKSVHSIVRDHVGYIWMGTAHGLNRFDGNDVKKYFHNSDDDYSISSDDISLIHEDSNGDIWISTSDGINRYNRKNDNFVRCKFSNTLGTNCIFETEDEIWFPDTNWKIHVYNKKDRSYNDKQLKPLFSNAKEQLYIDKIVSFDEEHFLIGTYYSGLYLLNKETGEISIFCQTPMSGIRGIHIVDHYIYCATYSNVLKISRTGKILKIFNEQNSGIKSHIILDMEFRDTDSTLWVATDGAGIQLFDKNFNFLNSLEIGPSASDILPDNSINDITFHSNGMVFLGTVRSGGIILYPSNFEQLSYSNQSKFGPSNKTILCFYEDRDGKIWVGTDGGGLNLFDRKKLTFDHFFNSDIQKITSISEFTSDVLLVGSYTKGLFFFNKKTHSFTDAHKHPLLRDINKNATHMLFRDSQNRLWVSDGRLWKVDTQKGSTVMYNNVNTKQFFQQINPAFISATENGKGTIWFSSHGGILGYSLKLDRFITRISLSNVPDSFGRSVYSVVEDRQGNLIFGTNKALLHYDLQTKKISNYITQNIPMSLMYLSLHYDKKNHLWVGTNEGLLRVNKNNSTEEISMFNTLGMDGGVEYFQASILKSSDGLVYFGSNEGITRFYPQSTEPYTQTPATVITSFSTLTSEKNNIKDSILAINVFNKYSIELDYSSASYQFNFNAFDIPFSESTEYSYRLEPFEDVWHTGKGRNAIYSNLPAGEYIFRVKARNRNGMWNNDTTNIHLKILPPWWKTRWFQSLLFLFMIVTGYIIWRAGMERIKLRQKILIKEKEREQLQEVNQLKLSFFTNISHELKTPLTLIYNPLQHLVKSGGSDKEFRSLLPFLYRNAQRMTLLIDQILDFRKSEMSELKLKVTKNDLVAHCNEILTYFIHQAKIENIHLSFKPTENQIKVWYDNDKLFKIVSNLITNALKHTPPNGHISISVYTEEKYAIVKVEDTGSGIPTTELDSIFERYYQVENNISGTGIGLALTKRLVELHNGTIKAISNKGEGATFIVTLPLGNEHFQTKDFATPNIDLPEVQHQPELIDIDDARIDNPDLSVLVVEDEWELREYVKELLSKNYTVITAKNGKEALNILLTNEPDLIISDVMMPQIDGIEFCKILKSDLRISHIPIIMLTAKTSVESHIEGLKSGADAYIAKPFNTSLLFTQIESILANRKIVKERFSHDLGLNTHEVTQSSADEKFLHKAISIVEKNMENPNFDVAAFVEQMAMSRTLVYSKAKAITGKPVKDFILNIKLRKAAELLKSSDKTISEIGFMCGFADPSYFSVVFKRYFKESPSAFRSKE